jgi:Restriction endonuclease BglII
MQIGAEYSYRYAKEILQAVASEELQDIQCVLNDPRNVLNADKAKSQRDYSAQIKNWFVSQKQWKSEQRCKAVPGMKYDLQKGLVSVEVEIGHQRLVFPDFFEFAADHAKQNIAAGVLIVTHEPMLFGHDWHCSLASTKLKIASVAEWLTVPLFVVASRGGHSIRSKF